MKIPCCATHRQRSNEQDISIKSGYSFRDNEVSQINIVPQCQRLKEGFNKNCPENSASKKNVQIAQVKKPKKQSTRMTFEDYYRRVEMLTNDLIP